MSSQGISGTPGARDSMWYYPRPPALLSKRPAAAGRSARSVRNGYSWERPAAGHALWSHAARSEGETAVWL